MGQKNRMGFKTWEIEILLNLVYQSMDLFCSVTELNQWHHPNKARTFLLSYLTALEIGVFKRNRRRDDIIIFIFSLLRI